MKNMNELIETVDIEKDVDVATFAFFVVIFTGIAILVIHNLVLCGLI